MSGRGAALTTADLDRYPMISPTVSQPSGVTAPILTLNQLSSQRVLQMPYFLACAWTLLDTDAYMVIRTASRRSRPSSTATRSTRPTSG